MTKELLLLTSPPASGKTFWIKSFKQALPYKSILVVSPLRALADECKKNWGKLISVMTPEEYLGKKGSWDVVIFDEFHLNFYWGDSFRPLMWEVFYEIVENTELTILLTATLTSEMEEEISLFSTHFDRIFWVNCGNQKLRTLPYSYIKFPHKISLLDFLFKSPRNDGTKLIFCAYKKEVFELTASLKKQGFSVIPCVGGESKFMHQRLEECPFPEFIVATTVLSHGVNLPVIQKIFFLYEVKNLDFWIQMVARGGRRGEKFQVFSLEKPYLMKWNPLKNYWKLLSLKLSRLEFPWLC